MKSKRREMMRGVAVDHVKVRNVDECFGELHVARCDAKAPVWSGVDRRDRNIDSGLVRSHESSKTPYFLFELFTQQRNTRRRWSSSPVRAYTAGFVSHANNHDPTAFGCGDISGLPGLVVGTSCSGARNTDPVKRVERVNQSLAPQSSVWLFARVQHSIGKALRTSTLAGFIL